jgi:hypothetical protein
VGEMRENLDVSDIYKNHAISLLGTLSSSPTRNCIFFDSYPVISNPSTSTFCIKPTFASFQSVFKMEHQRKVSIVPVESQHDNVLRVQDTNILKMSVSNADAAVEASEAKAATDREHNMTLRDAFKLYPKAIAFSLIFSMAVVMEGYDTALLGSFYGFGQFKNRYGMAPERKLETRS